MGMTLEIPFNPTQTPVWEKQQNPKEKKKTIRLAQKLAKKGNIEKTKKYKEN
jgi:hypothetical protein